MGNCCVSSSPAHTTALSTPGTSTTNINQSSNEVSSSSSGAASRGGGSQEKESGQVGGEILAAHNLKVYGFEELKKVTNNFRADGVLGLGGFGTVYRGWVDEKTLAPSKIGTGMVVAIKRLNPESKQGVKEWQSEVNFLGRLSHPNLVKLLGYCLEGEELLLVYEFMPKGSLEIHLFKRVSATEPLSWDLRLNIALGAAKGLAFLHSSDKQIIYRDFKTPNILLDENYNAKLADFGLAKLGPLPGNTHVTTQIMGTHGYAAPEYIATGHLYVKSDVYGFGVVLLELLTGLRAFEKDRPKKQQDLIEWAKPLLPHRRKLKSIIDGRMEGQYSSKAASRLARLTLKCLGENPRARPSMNEVVEALERIQGL
ncbi:probable serine/threonine-protein kinase PIX13 [Malania oleifera]|uniref:probable serine/threonine-protein kinase PIX13 n=1 Tax=Malania oleifera TaxID=397392 RepID=UPI0025AE6B86|nr:probable serine/threonine-protein kinase PIX13 [Malania oleifera]